MKDSYLGILGIDVGTSSLKAVVFNEQGKIQASSRVAYAYTIPRPDWAEMDPEIWWQALKKALDDLAGQNGNLKHIAAISFTGQMHTAILLNKIHTPATPVLLWLDRRAAPEMEELKETLRLPPYQLNSTYTLPKLLWLYRHQARLMEKVDRILWPKDYLRWRFTGEFCTDATDAMGSGLYDWEAKRWDTERLKLVGLSPRVLPPIKAANADGGKILPQVAEELGLNPNAKVVIGMGDMAALIGGAPLVKGRVVYSLGSSSMIFSRLFDQQTIHPSEDALYSIDIGNFRLFGGVSSTTGAALDWLYGQIFSGPERKKSFESFIESALQVKPGAEGLCFLPYLAGERSPYWNDHMTGGFYGLKLSHDMRHLTRAVLEGVAFSLRHILDIYRISGVQVEELALAAGGTRTPGWAQIIADICQMPVAVFSGQETVTRVLFALCMDYLNRGDFEETLVSSFAEPRTVPYNHESAGIYEEIYGKYRGFSQFAMVNAKSIKEKN